jgi:uncharacterized membrane protein YhaH (DUF805 family)
MFMVSVVRSKHGALWLSTSSLLFSFQGRISRQPYWLVSAAMIALTSVLFGILVVAGASVLAGGLAAMADGALWLLVLYVPMIWIGLAVAAKRLHDRDKSAWWLLLFYALPVVLDGIGEALGGMGMVLSLVSLAISIWAMVELGFLHGTPGPNRYGPDPLGA